MGELGNLLQQQLASLQLQVAQLIMLKAAPTLSYNIIPYNATPSHHLDGTNYSDWAHQLQSSLIGHGLLQLVLNAKPEPTNATMAEAMHRQQHLNIAYVMITTQLNPTVQDWIGDEETNPQVMWK
jgi:hypothetical protein